MARPAVLKIDIISDLQGKGFGQAESALGQMGRKAQVAAAALGGGLVAGGLAAVKAASDLGESVNAVNKVFGPAADTITSFGENAATQVGLSQQAFQQLATSTGSLLTNFGYSQQEAADATTELATRAADMASVFNTDVDTALNAINAGLRGETEPLRAFGVNLNDATLKAKALELGLYSGTGALDANAKAAAAQAVIMEQTAATQGDFADTSDSLANAQRIMSAQITDLAAQLGEALLPAAESVISQLQGMVEWAGENTGAVQAMAAAAAAFVGVVLGATAAMKAYRAAVLIAKATQQAWTIATKAMTVAQRALNMAMRMNPIGIIITLIAGLIAVVVTAYQRSETFRNIVDTAFAAIKQAISNAMQAARSAVEVAWNVIKTLFEWSPVGFIISNWSKIVDVFRNIFERARSVIQGAIDRIKSAIQTVANVARSVINGVIGGFNAAINIANKLPGVNIPNIGLLTVPELGQPAPYAAAGVAPMMRSSRSVPVGTRQTGNVIVNVNGALDPDAVARQIRRILTTHDRRTGRAYLTPAASGAI